MKLTVDQAACVGCGLCVNACPDRFEMDDGGFVKVKNGNCTCDLHEVAAMCPVNAIVVKD